MIKTLEKGVKLYLFLLPIVFSASLQADVVTGFSKLKKMKVIIYEIGALLKIK